MHLGQATTPAQALYRVFVSPCASPPTPLLTHSSRRCVAPCLDQRQRRHLNRYRKVTAEQTPSIFNDPTKPVDEAIKASSVHMVRDGKLTSNQSLRSLLAEVRQINLKKQNEGAAKGETLHVRQHALHGDGKPIVRLITEKEAWEQVQAQTRKTKPVEDKAKQLELNWALDQRGDLQHRLARLEEFLKEGRRVEILLARKKGGRRATPEEMESLLEQIRASVSSIEGAVETKPMEGQLGGKATLFFGFKDPVAARASSKAAPADPSSDQNGGEKEDKKARKEREREERRAKEAERQKRAEEREAELEKQRGFKVEDL